MTYKLHASFDKLKKSAKNSLFSKTKSGDSKKVVMVRKTLMWNFMCNFLLILVYILLL